MPHEEESESIGYYVEFIAEIFKEIFYPKSGNRLFSATVCSGKKSSRYEILQPSITTIASKTTTTKVFLKVDQSNDSEESQRLCIY